MLFFENMALRRGKKVLFEDASFIINPKDKVGVTGANGTGKSSLFALIRGELEEDSGNFSMAGNVTISSVRQETPAVETSALEYVIEGDVELCEIEAALVKAEAEEDGNAIGKLHQQLDTIQGYSARARAGALMHGLGFTADQEQLPVSSFSGGWRMRLNLAQALMCRSDLLLLDEPTNHLDFEAVVWLEKWLESYQGAVLLISHDRDFLDRVIDRVAHIEQQHIKLYSGNYSSFELQRAEQLAQQQANYERQQKEIAHMQSYITRFKAKASKAKQAQSRVKALERMEKISAAHVDSPFNFSFPELGHVPSPLLQLKEVNAGYEVKSEVESDTEEGSVTILNKVGFTLLPNDRVGLLGKNGAGKSTLIKVLAGELAVQAGERVEAKHLNIGYFAQHQLEQLHPQMSPIQHLQREYPDATEQELRNFLGGFDFHGDKALEPVAPFSGGEKARLVLALLVYSKPNVLLLDEPTNHLDLEMRHAMNVALQGFEGAVVLVSHDKHMLRTVSDDLYLVADSGVKPFQGDLDDYAKWALEQSTMERRSNKDRSNKEKADDAPSDAQPEVSRKDISRKEQRRIDAEKRKALQPLKNKLRKVEQEMDKVQKRKQELDELMTEPSIYDDANKGKLAELSSEYGEVRQRLETLEEDWLMLNEELEG